MPDFKVVIATDDGSPVAVICESFAVEWVKGALQRDHPSATITVADAATHWSAVIIRRPDRVAIEEYGRHNRAEMSGAGRYGW